MKFLSFVCFLFYYPILVIGQCVDTEPPVIGNPPPIQITAECDSIPEYDLMASDNSGFYIVEYDEELFLGSCLGTLLRSWSVIDSCGNETNASQVVNLQDISPPIILEAPSDTTIDCDDIIPEVPVLEAFDNCDEEPEITFSENIIPTGLFPIILRTWMAMDICGNQTTWQQQIFIVDMEAPELNFVQDTTIILLFGQDMWQLPDLTLWGSITDNCDDMPSFSQSLTAGTMLSIGNNQIDIITSDASGNDSGTTINIWIDQSVGIDNLKNNQFQIYPNPASNQIRLSFSSFSELPHFLVIRDMTGRIIFHHNIRETHFSIPLDGWTKGIYHVIIDGSETVNVKRMVIE